MRYAIVSERAETSASACMPDLAGCVATGNSIEETESAIRSAIKFHLQGLREDNPSIPAASSHVDYFEVAA
jgi:predicted RNase H-like HicB family nuclease